MSREIPLEITHLRDRLRQDFTGRLPEVTSPSLEERERNFLSRALAAFAIQRLSGCTVDEAAVAVVDGSGDSGIDAIHYAPASHRLWLVQSKFFADGQGEPALGDVSKFRNGLEALLHGQFDVFRGNAALERKIPQLQDHFDDSSLEVRAILVYSGIHLVSEDRIRLFEALRHRFSPDSDYFAFQRYNLTSIHGWLTGEHEGVGVEVVDITLHYPGQVSTPFETYYGLMSLTDVATLYTTYGEASPELSFRRRCQECAYLSPEATRRVHPRADVGAPLGEGHRVRRGCEQGVHGTEAECFTAAATDTTHDFRQTVQERTRIAQMLFGGFQRCLYTNQKFQSDSERRLAIILDREALKWFKPVRGQFQLYYKLSTDHLEYQPDFVAETVDYIYMLEANARNDVHDVEVRSKKDAAVQWCSHATRHALSNGGKPWQYLLIPHDVITENMTIAGLASQFGVD